jgi:hypothetical protein
MTILDWTSPKKVMTTGERARNYGFDGGPPGGYVPNMSEDDAAQWRAKLVGHKSGHPQVEIRKTAGEAQILLIVSLGDGYKYKYYTPEGTKGINVHLSLNGAAQMSFQEMAEMAQAVEEAKAHLMVFLDSQIG